MLDFVARVFRGWMNVLLWLILIGCVIGGFIVFGNVFGGRRFSFGYAILGLIIGSLIGLISIILSGGLIANFLNMVDNVEKQTAILMYVYRNDLPKEVISKIVNNKETVDNNNEPSVSTPSIPLANNQLKITRLKGVVGSAILVDIKLDNQVFQLENGEEKIFNIENGKHKITAFFNNDDDKLEFDINNNSKAINVFIKPPIKIQEV